MPLFAKRVNASATSSTWTSVSTASVDLANRKTVSTIPRSSRDGSRSTRSNFLPTAGFLGPATIVIVWKKPFRSSRCENAQELRRVPRSEEHTSELQSRRDLVCRLLLEKKKKNEIT